MKYTLDTYAWIEYFEGSSQGNKVKEIIENEDESLLTPSIVLVELADAVVKGKLNVQWEDVVRFVKLNTKIITIDENIAHAAGTLKNTLRKKHPDFGIIDAVVLATARINHSKLLTGDPHLTTEDDVIDIKMN